MILLDSNIIIYSLSPSFQQVREFLKGKSIFCSVISKIEVLGYSKLSQNELNGFIKLFDALPIIQISDSIVESAIKLRQKRKMTLGDALIAATAIDYKLELITANTKDFDWIKEIKLNNPLI